MKKVSVSTEGKTYEIQIESGLLTAIPQILASKFHDSKFALMADSNVFELYGKAFISNLEGKGLFVEPLIFDAGESSKNLSTISYVYDTLANNRFTRSDVVVALGGGVTGDMAGLAAATFLRGMKFIQIPTTLLAMVDSSIGGKVAVNLPQGKNLIGAFYQPDEVYIDPKLLKTLSDRQFSNGMAELIKHGIIMDANLFSRLIAHSNLGYNYKSLSESLDEYIFVSCQIKRKIVEKDEYDNGMRQLLNFGHTIGHAIERVQKYSGLSHGEAISVGMAIMTQLTEKMGITQKGETDKLKNALHMIGLPIALPKVDISDLVNAISLDKKNRSGKISIACIEKIGRSILIEMDLEKLEGNLYELLADYIKTP